MVKVNDKEKNLQLPITLISFKRLKALLRVCFFFHIYNRVLNYGKTTFKRSQYHFALNKQKANAN